MANILVIDDDKDIQRLLEFAFKRAGHTVEAAFDGEQGLSVAETRPPDLIVCDVMMPKMTGYDFCRQARTKPKLKNTPIIVFSARFQPVDKQTALDAGATDYLPKSTAPDVLINRIAELLPRTGSSQAAQVRGEVDAVNSSMLALFSLRGGTGVTSLAVNLAIALAQLYQTKTTLVDLVPVGGHSALMLGLRPITNVATLLNSVPGNFTAQSIAPYLMQHSTGVQLLASPPTYGQNSAHYNDELLRFLGSLKTTCPISILDIPRLLEPHFSPVLLLIDKLFLVLSADMPSVQAAVIALQGLTALGMDPHKINLIVNQTSQYNPLPIEIIQKAIRRPIAITIPFDQSMTKAVNSGQPLLTITPQSATALAISQLAKMALN
jgi:pilus assembly protein CpaE